MTKKIRVLVIDDSSMVRHAITDALNLDPEIEVVGVANDPLIAMDKIPKLMPDVLTLDMEMPRMDGLTFLRKLKSDKSTIPVIVISSLTQQGSQMALKAMDAGACEVLAKPDGSTSIGVLAGKLAFHVKAAARSRRRSFAPSESMTSKPGNAFSIALSPASTGLVAKVQQITHQVRRVPLHNDKRLIVIGSSTGGVEALRFLLPSLPDSLPPIAVVQHIPAFFSKAVAERINELSAYEVREAVDNEPLLAGQCLLAPGNYHMAIVDRGGYRVRLTQSPPIHHCRPAVDVLFRSAAEVAGAHVLAVLLTGMGSDGAIGMQHIKNAGGRTLAEHENSCVVYGMPRAAIELGVVDRAVMLNDMPRAIVDAVGGLPH
jgi:two-component system chemotaxis response regulator CheB